MKAGESMKSTEELQEKLEKYSEKVLLRKTDVMKILGVTAATMNSFDDLPKIQFKPKGTIYYTKENVLDWFAKRISNGGKA